jgi:signal transduction histidine kinase
MSTYNILLVDDEVSNLNALERTLKREYGIFSATNGKDALSIMEQNHIDLIIADHRMPGMTGVEFLEKAWRRHPDTIRIILTAYTDQKLLMDAVNTVHAHGYLTKPWDPEEIKAIIRRWQVSQAAQKRLEAEILKAQELESYSVFAGGIANDFDGILTDVLGNLYLTEIYVKADGASNRAFESIAEAKKASLEGKDLTRQLLTFSRGGVPAKKATSIGEILKISADFALKGSRARCEFSIPDDLWPVEADEGQIGPAISNLITNADHAMPDGGVIRVRAENVNVDMQHGLPLRLGAYVKISIEDQGIGISEEHLQRIFNPYFTTKQKGNGLGLSTSYSIIKNHNGHIALESQMGTGTTFHIYLPASPNGDPNK